LRGIKAKGIAAQDDTGNPAQIPDVAMEVDNGIGDEAAAGLESAVPILGGELTKGFPVFIYQ